MKTTGLLALLLLSACGSTPPVPPAPPPAAPPTAPAVDALGARPALAAPRPFTPPVPTLVSVPGAPPVWLLERPGLPLVVVHVVVPYGSAADPPGKGGLAALTAEMMEKGAGRRASMAFSLEVQRLGAALSVSAGRDQGDARLAVLKPRLEPALALLADVVARPRFEAAEWDRMRPQWITSLRAGAFEPSMAGALAADLALFGPTHPYGHPVDGTPASVERLTVDDVRRFHRTHWRRDRATVIVAGDLTAAEVRALFTRRFLEWGAVGPPPPVPAPSAVDSRPRAVAVARPGAPQTLLLAVAQGSPAADEDRAALELANQVLGGMFTSRLNQKLREEKGYSYGATSALPFQRGPYRVTAQASVEARATAAAIVDLRAELSRFSATGPDEAELEKARATARAIDVETYEAVDEAADRLAMLASLGLPRDFDAEVARRREAVTLDDVRRVATTLALAEATLVAVGDPAVVEPALRAAGFRDFDRVAAAER